MTSQGHPPTLYTEPPALHTNLLLGSLQLLCWVFCRPTAWQHHVAQIDPTLHANFALVELRRVHWRHQALRRLLLMTVIVRSVFVGVPVGVMLWTVQCPGENLAFGIALSIAVALAGGLVGDAVLSVPSGMVGGWVGGLASGVGHGIAGIETLVGVFTTDMVGIVSLGVASCMALGMGGSVITSLAGRHTASAWGQQLGVIALGIVSVGLAYGAAFALALGLAQGVVGSVAFGVAMEAEVTVAFGMAVGWRTHSWRPGVGLGVVFGVVVIGTVVGAHAVVEHVPPSVLHGAALGIAAGASGSMFMGAACALPYVLAERLAGVRTGAVAGVLGAGSVYIMFASLIAHKPVGLSVPIGLVCSLAGLTMMWWRPFLCYPFQQAWGLILYRADERHAGALPSRIRWHAVFWDEHQRWPLFGLEDHLVLLAERHPAEGRAALAYVASSHQRWAAQAAQIELEARQLARCTDVRTIRHAHRALATGDLMGPAGALLRSFSRISQDVDAALHQSSHYNQRLALRSIEEALDGRLRELTRSDEPYAQRFAPILQQWYQCVAEALRELTDMANTRQEIDSPYILGVPLTIDQEIFVGRTDVSARIEHLLTDRRRPPLLLYGQRRMGKTSLLNNLGRLLPTTIVPLFVDLQGPASSASDHAGLLYNIARSMVGAAQRQRHLTLPPLRREALAHDPFTGFDEWLDNVEQALESQMVLLALDEFEALDSALDEGRFSATAVLGMLRHLIQHRPRFKVLLAGSHTLDELQRWSSYLINVQVVHIGYLSEAAAQQLIEHPIKDFPLHYAPDATQRVLALTRCHPFLVQLLCAEIVARKNEQDPTHRRLACLADVEAAVPDALRHGAFFFADIAHSQVDAYGQALLQYLAAQGEGAVVTRAVCAQQFPAALERTLTLLVQRELIEGVEAGYRFQVELIRRWFAACGV